MLEGLLKLAVNLIECNNKILYRLLLVILSLIIFISPTFLFICFFYNKAFEEYGDIKSAGLCLTCSCSLFFVLYYIEGLRGIHCDCKNMKLKIEKNKTLSVILMALVDMVIISVGFIIVYSVMFVLQGEFKVKIGIFTLVGIIALRMLSSVLNYIGIKKEIKIREEERMIIEEKLRKVEMNSSKNDEAGNY